MNTAHVSADRSANAQVIKQVLATLLGYDGADLVKQVEHVAPTSPLTEVKDVPIGYEVLGSVCACSVVDLEQAGLQQAGAPGMHYAVPRKPYDDREYLDDDSDKVLRHFHCYVCDLPVPDIDKFEAAAADGCYVGVAHHEYRGVIRWVRSVREKVDGRHSLRVRRVDMRAEYEVRAYDGYAEYDDDWYDKHD